jgi:hypothetical protein
VYDRCTVTKSGSSPIFFEQGTLDAYVVPLPATATTSVCKYPMWAEGTTPRGCIRRSLGTNSWEAADRLKKKREGGEKVERPKGRSAPRMPSRGYWPKSKSREGGRDDPHRDATYGGVQGLVRPGRLHLLERDRYGGAGRAPDDLDRYSLDRRPQVGVAVQPLRVLHDYGVGHAEPSGEAQPAKVG